MQIYGKIHLWALKNGSDALSRKNFQSRLFLLTLSVFPKIIILDTFFWGIKAIFHFPEILRVNESNLIGFESIFVQLQRKKVLSTEKTKNINRLKQTAMNNCFPPSGNYQSTMSKSFPPSGNYQSTMSKSFQAKWKLTQTTCGKYEHLFFVNSAMNDYCWYIQIIYIQEAAAR